MTDNPSSTTHKKPGLRLFWKILLWFWLSMALIITLNLFIHFMRSDDIRYQPIPPMIERELQHLKNVFERQANLNKPRKKFRRHHETNVFLLDEQGRSQLGGKVPSTLFRLHQKSLEEHKPLAAFHKQKSWFGGYPVETNEGRLYIYLRRLDPMFDRHVVGRFFRDQARSLLISIFIISFPLSFLLTLLLTRPIRKLQLATLQLKENIGQRDKLTQLTKRGDEFAELAEDINGLAAHIEKLLTSQKQLISDVSHELRSPLSRMQIAVGIARQQFEKRQSYHQQKVESDQSEIPDNKSDDHSYLPASAETDAESVAIQRIEKEISQMESMLEKILLISQLEASEVEPKNARFDLRELAELVIQDAQFEASQRKISIEVDMAIEQQMEGDQSLMMSGLENILRNAIRYADSHIRVTLNRAESSGFTLCVEDDGPGVDDDQLDKLFDDFYRPQTDRASHSGGIGLGLSIAKRAFAINGGKISAHNRPAGGLCICVEFMSQQ